MHIEFVKVKFKNFLSAGNAFVEMDLNQNRQTLIVGDNGSGKSTLLEAITFALFNKPYRNINKPQLVNSINQRDMLVELYFNITNDQYMIRRGIKPNIFEIYKNGQMLNQEAENRDYQEFLEENIIKLKHKSFTQTIIMGTASFTPFMQLNAQNRRSVVEDLLDLQVFGTMNVLLKGKQNDVKVSLTSTENLVAVLREKIKLHQQYLDQLNSDKNEQLKEIEQEIADLEQEQQNNNILATEKTNQIDLLNKQIAENTKLKPKLTNLQTLTNQLETKLNRIATEISFFHDNDECPTCKQGISDQLRSDAIQSRSTVKTEITQAIDKIKHQHDAILPDYEKVSEWHNQVILLQHQLSTITKDIHNNVAQSQRLKEQTIKIANAKSIQVNDQQAAVLQSQFLEQQQKLDQLTIDKNVLDTVGLLLKDTGIKSQIIKTYIPIINKFVNKYLEDMNFFVNFELDENFNEVIKSRHRDSFSYASFSEGEKLRLNLALIFAWRAIAKMRSSTTTNIIFFDEILDSSLDYDGIDTFFKIIYEMSSGCNIFVISHKTDMVDKFTNIIRVEKSKGFSKWIY